MVDGPVLVFIGPSASGKSTLVRELHRQGSIVVTPTWTTRPRRNDELGGTIEHRFVTEAQFVERERSGFFLEVVQLFGLPYRYGLPRLECPENGHVAAIMARAPLMPLVRRHFAHYVVYQVEGSYDDVRERLFSRERAGTELGTRLEGYEEERLVGRRLADRVFLNATSIDSLASAVTRAMGEDFTPGEIGDE